MEITNSEEHNKGPFKRPFKGRFLFTMSTEGYLVEFHKVNYFVETPASLLVNKHFFSTSHFTGVFSFRVRWVFSLSQGLPSLSLMNMKELVKLRTPHKQIADNLL